MQGMRRITGPGFDTRQHAPLIWLKKSIPHLGKSGRMYRESVATRLPFR
jgi:hypothetical protein